MRIVLANPSRASAWDEYAAAHPGAGPYHRWAWMTAVERAYGFGAAPLMAVRGEAVAGILPLVRLNLPGRAGRLISLPYCDFGGPLADDPATAQALVDHALELAQSRGAAGVEIRSQGPLAADAPKVLMRLALPAGSQGLFDAFPAKLRSQVRKPQRDGLRAATGGADLLEAFYRVFTANMRDLGSPTHSLEWFRQVVRGFGDSARITVVYLPDDRAAAAGMCLTQGNTAFVPWASSLREHQRLNPNMLLYWTMLARAADAGLAAFDFGRSTPGEGTYRFKKQWGAGEMGLCWRAFDPATGEILSAVGGGRSRPRRLAEACWRRLPLGLANAAGPLLRRYISL